MQNWVGTERSEKTCFMLGIIWGNANTTVKKCNISAGHSKRLNTEVPPWISYPKLALAKDLQWQVTPVVQQHGLV